MNDLSFTLGTVTIAAFAVNIIVQLTKEFIALPTKLWCIIISAAVSLGMLFVASAKGLAEFNTSNTIISVAMSLMIAFVSMNGFDTFKELWERFRKGENINE